MVRIIVIALGMMSALALARDGLGFNLLPFLDAVATAYGILFDDLFKDIVLSAFEPVFSVMKRWFELNWTLYPHWKHVFVLLWLLFAAAARAFGSNIGIAQWIYSWVWAAIPALVASVFAGTVELKHPGVFWWPAAGLWLFLAGDTAWTACWFPDLGRVRLARTEITWLSAAVLSSLVALQVVPLGNFLFLTSPSPGLAMLAALVSFVGVLLLIGGAIGQTGDGDTFLQKWLGDGLARIGLDVLAVLGGATILVYVGYLVQ